MSRALCLLIPFLLAGANQPYAQEAGNPRSGRLLAREMCASCHAVLKGERLSPVPQAPSFERIARVPGMTQIALSVALQTSHKTMPNIMLNPEELRDVTAYITSLRTRR